MTDFATGLTPREITRRLDDYIVGQPKAKRAVAVALRNRWRRRQLGPELAADVYPKNILLIGPTGVGKTEIARRLATLARAPFVKVEATKYSETGYHGRDVESMVRDMVDASIALVRAEKVKEVEQKAADAAEHRIYEALLEELGLEEYQDGSAGMPGIMEGGFWKPLPPPEDDPAAEHAPVVGDARDPDSPQDLAEREQARARLKDDLRERRLEARVVEVEVRDTATPTLSVMGPQGNETMGIDAAALQEMWGRSPGSKTKIRKLTIQEARELLHEEEADKLLDQDQIVQDALDRAQNDGIVFVDEIDKIVSSGGSDGPDVSREGVQRDLLSVVEGCAV